MADKITQAILQLLDSDNSYFGDKGLDITDQDLTRQRISIVVQKNRLFELIKSTVIKEIEEVDYLK